MDFEDTQVSAEQEGVVGSPTDTEGIDAEAGENEQGAAAPESGEKDREAAYNRGMAAARRQGGKRAREEVDAEFANLGFEDEDGKPIRSAREAREYLQRQGDARLKAEAERTKRSVEDLKKEKAERATGRAVLDRRKAENEIDEQMQRDVREFAEEYPDVDLRGLLKEGSKFLRFCGSRFAKEPLTELYEAFLDVAGSAESKQKATEKEKRATGSGSGNAGKSGLSADQRKALDEWNKAFPGMKMTEKEFMERS